VNGVEVIGGLIQEQEVGGGGGGLSRQGVETLCGAGGVGGLFSRG